MTDKKTILHVAQESGVSPATVSRVMNNHRYVKDSTREKVLNTINLLEYQRDNIAYGLRSSKTKVIGLIVPRISMYFHSAAITVIQNSLYKNGYQLMICQSDDKAVMEKELVNILQSARVDAVIAACSLHTTDFSHFNILMKRGIPVIFYDRVPMHNTDAILIKGDDFNGGYIAASYLIKKGCKKIAHISGPIDCNLYKERTTGFEKAMQEKKLPIKSNWVFHQELTAENARAALNKIFSAKVLPDGLLADNDTTAIATLQFAKENGIKVPQDLKIVGYSNDPRSTIVSPSITTIEQFPDIMGMKVVEVLMNILSDKNKDIQKVYTVAVSLVERESA
ncbi:MAG: LacI family DNA-binding transcriptional regulator [Arachidicoccus sp.]|nr:LacI family DNA-binding transcriptional regulator [Arachidicoccus sp.]